MKPAVLQALDALNSWCRAGDHCHHFTPDALPKMRTWLHDRLLLAVSHHIRDRQNQPGYPHSITP